MNRNEYITHLQQRNNASTVNGELSDDFMRENSICENYGYRTEMHIFFFDCPKCNDERKYHCYNCKNQ